MCPSSRQWAATAGGARLGAAAQPPHRPPCGRMARRKKAADAGPVAGRAALYWRAAVVAGSRAACAGDRPRRRLNMPVPARGAGAAAQTARVQAAAPTPSPPAAGQGARPARQCPGVWGSLLVGLLGSEAMVWRTL